MTRLEENTLKYWNLNLLYNGRIKGKLTVEQALNTLTSLSAKTGPHRKLAGRLFMMRSSIVNHGDCAGGKR